MLPLLPLSCMYIQDHHDQYSSRYNNDDLGSTTDAIECLSFSHLPSYRLRIDHKDKQQH